MEIVLMLAGAGISYVIIERIYIKFWLKGLSAQIGFATDYATPGDIVNLLEVVTNEKWMPLHFINVKFQLDRNLKFDNMDANSVASDKSYKNDVFSLLFYQKITRTIPLLCKKRGYYTIDKIELLSMGLFMNDISSVSIPIASELVVYPAFVNTEAIEVPFRKIMGAIITNKHIYEDPFEFKGIRDYQDYDSMDKINWKATAKTSELKVNFCDYTASQEVCILLNLEYEGMIKYEALLEESISIAASLMQMLIESGVSTSIICNGKDILTDENIFLNCGNGFDHINSINLGLARIDLKKPADDFTELLIDNLSKISNNALYILISSCKSSKIQEEYNRMCYNSKGSIWIVPYNNGFDCEPKNCEFADIISWEVPYYD